MENLFGPDDDDDDYPDVNDEINMGYGASTVEIDVENDLARGFARLPTPPDDINLDAELYPRPGGEPSLVPAAKPPDVVDLGIDKEVVIKQKSTRAKLDNERLLSAEGLLTIRRRAPKVRFKGKGHEYRYLGRLLECYQIWGHQLFPKANFEDFLAMTERLGRSKQMKIVRRQLIDEWKPARLPEEKSDLDQRQTYDDGTGFVVDAGFGGDDDDNDDENREFGSQEHEKTNAGDNSMGFSEAGVTQPNDDLVGPGRRNLNHSHSSMVNAIPEQNPTPPRSDAVPSDVPRSADSQQFAPSPGKSPGSHQSALFLFDDDDDDDDLYD
ncbi:replication fork protection component Swi3-domain-containing protein [Lipomyces chichibuensis]|uniref:replication fork protection component Swi3-domain-containing protein n=1 Tax=Lipomyces chichibuensis TaxID=1546026 RepID=UPI0033432642